MKRINNQKGFTLIELLAVIIILAIIMTIAIPNIVGTLDKNKKDSFIKDARRAIISCEYTIKTEKKYEYPDESTAVVFPLRKLKNLDLDVSPYDTYYSLDDSFVAITKDKVSGSNAYEYQYYVHLVSCETDSCRVCQDEECDDTEGDYYSLSSKNRGINLETSQMIEGSSRFDLIVKGDEVILDYLHDNQYVNLRDQLNTLRSRKENQISISEVIVY